MRVKILIKLIEQSLTVANFEPKNLKFQDVTFSFRSFQLYRWRAMKKFLSVLVPSFNLWLFIIFFEKQFILIIFFQNCIELNWEPIKLLASQFISKTFRYFKTTSQFEV